MLIKQAVRALRAELGDSQQAFATRLNVSIRAIVNYEKGRLPAPEVLASFAHLASEHDLFLLCRVFWEGLPNQLQWRPKNLLL